MKAALAGSISDHPGVYWASPGVTCRAGPGWLCDAAWCPPDGHLEITEFPGSPHPETTTWGFASV